MSNIVELIVKAGMDKGTQSVKELNKQYKQSNKELKEQQELVKNISNELLNMKSVRALGGIAAMVKGIKTITNGMIKATQSQTAYIENLNLLNNAYGDVTNSGQKLVNQIANIVGFDQSNLTKSLGTYRQISTALGIAGNNADMLAENLLKMQTDVSSLYNLDFDVAGQKLTSAITGQSRAVKVLGADITDAGLQQTAYRLNIDKSVESMTQAEKTILRYITLDQQLKNSQGDTARTINSVATQTRIWKEQLEVLGRQIGAFLIPVLNSILPILNGILMAANAVISTILSLFGWNAETLADEFGTAEVSVDGFGASLDNSAASAKKLKNSLRGFDKLNVITTPTSTSGDSGGASGVGAVDKKMLDALKEYDLQLEKVKNKSTDIRDKILGWLGFTVETNEETKKLNVKFDHITGGTVLGALVVGGVIFLGIYSIYKIFKKITDLFGKKSAKDSIGDKLTDDKSVSKTSNIFGKFLDKLGTATIIISILGGIALAIKQVADLFKVLSDGGYKATDVLIIMSSIIGSLTILIIALTAATKILSGPEALLSLVTLTASISAILLVLKETLPTILDCAGDFIVKTAPSIIAFVKTLIEGLENIIYAMGTSLPPVINSIGNLFSKIFDGISKVVNSVGDVIVDILKTIDNTVANVFNSIIKFITKLGKSINTFVDDAIEAITKLINFLISAIEYTFNLLIIDSINKFLEGLNKIPGVDFDPLQDINIRRFKPVLKEDGGFLNTGQMFIARESGPEMVGTIGNQTAVANNDQIVEAISIGVAKAMVSSGSKDVNITINAEGDSSGLLNFIEFKQKERNRQYGL